MRRLAIGCGSVVLVLLIVGGAAAWWFIGRPIASVAATVRDVQRIEATYQDVENRSAYQPPEDGVLSEAQLDRWLEVQTIMQASLADTAEQLRGRVDELEARVRDPRPQEIAGILRDTADLVVDAARVHVRALNANGFSVEEYRWVRNQVLQAAGYSLAGYDLTQLAAAATAEDGGALPAAPGAGVPPPPINVERIAPYLDRIEEALVFAWFGL